MVDSPTEVRNMPRKRETREHLSRSRGQPKRFKKEALAEQKRLSKGIYRAVREPIDEVLAAWVEMRRSHKAVKSYSIHAESITKARVEGTTLSTNARVATEHYLKAVKHWEESLAASPH